MTIAFVVPTNVGLSEQGRASDGIARAPFVLWGGSCATPFTALSLGVKMDPHHTPGGPAP